MMVGNAVSSSIMRQMEYDADRYEVRLVGPKVFESTVRDLISLGAAYQRSLSDLSGLWQERRLADNLPRLHELRRLHGVLGTLWSKLSENAQNQQNQALIHGIERRMGELHALLEGIWSGLRDEPYPFDHARGETTLAEVILPQPPEPQNLPALYQGSGQVIEGLLDLYLRVLGRLARIAEEVEAGLGLEPIQEREAKAS